MLIPILCKGKIEKLKRVNGALIFGKKTNAAPSFAKLSKQSAAVAYSDASLLLLGC